MSKEKIIEILMQDRCTRKEAEEALKRGPQIYENPDEYFQELKDNDVYEDETMESIREGKYADLTAVNYEGKEYLVVYVN